MTYIPPPKILPAFPQAKRTKPKSYSQGGKLRARWKDEDFVYEWDSFHGRVEKYDRLGNHLGEFDPLSGIQTKIADPERQIEP